MAAVEPARAPVGVFGEPLRPYRPGIEAPTQSIGGPVQNKAKPWLALRNDETSAQWQDRLSHTCWKCGTFIVDRDALDQHENEHTNDAG